MPDSAPAPEPIAGERPSGGETALVVVDMQHSYFERPDLAARLAELTEAVVELVRTAVEAGRPVVLVRTEHERDRSTWTLNMLEDGEGFAFPGTRQAAVLDEVARAARGAVVEMQRRVPKRANLIHTRSSASPLDSTGEGTLTAGASLAESRNS